MMSGARDWLVTPARASLSALALAACLTTSAGALPLGRAWSSPETIQPLAWPYVWYARFEPAFDGAPYLLIMTQTGTTSDIAALEWSDSTWIVRWDVGQRAGWLDPVAATGDQRQLAWWTTDDYGREYHIVLSQFTRDSVTRPDTVTSMIADPGPNISAAASREWRWVMVYDPLVERLRLLTSRVGAPWELQELVHDGFYGMPLVALDDSTCVLVLGDGGVPGLQWALIRGSRVEFAAQRLTDRTGSNGPRFRRRPSGGYWLSWGTYDPYVVVSHFGPNGWAEPETLHTAYRKPEDRPGSYGPDMSRDGYEYPALAWGAQNMWAEVVICVSVPSDSGFGPGEEIPEAAGGCSPTVARDPNGDVWLAWKPCDPPDNERFMHTYTRATCGLPVVQARGRSRQVHWRLTETAPGSWWTVLRALNDGPFEAKARMRAGDDLSMSWTDSVVPRGLVRYRIRRDCLDKRYEWTSDEARWPAPGTRPLLLHISEQPVTGVARLLVVDAVPGPVEIEVFDLQGRRVVLQRIVANGTGRDAVELDLRQQSPRLPAGVYFARAVEAGGRESDAARLVMLR